VRLTTSLHLIDVRIRNLTEYLHCHSRWTQEGERCPTRVSKIEQSKIGSVRKIRGSFSDLLGVYRQF
jgi:hypothetical protein